MLNPELAKTLTAIWVYSRLQEHFTSVGTDVHSIDKPAFLVLISRVASNSGGQKTTLLKIP